MKRKTILLCTSCVGIVVIILGVILKFVVIPIVVKSKVAETIALRPGSEAYERWEKLPVPVLFKVKFFEVLNPDQILNGSKPQVKERGPFVYIERREKENIIVVEEEDRAVYHQKTTFEFSEDLSDESDEIEFTTVNMPALAFAQIAESLPGLRSTLLIFNKVINKMWPEGSVFIRAKPKDVLFDGINMLCHGNGSNAVEALMWKMMCLAYAYIRPEKLVILNDGEVGLNTFALFRHKKARAEGPFEVKMGIREPETIGNIISWKGSRHLGDMWGGETCNTISGTDSTIFRPNLHDVNTVSAFNVDICRSINLTYAGPEEYKGVPVRRYVGGSDVFASVKEKPENYCYCTRSVKGLTSYGGCLKSGLLDASSCQGAPATASYPHLLMADSDYAGMVDGLEPNISTHQIFVDLEPNTGYPMRGAARAQINVFLKKIVEVDAMKDLPNTLLPVLWLDEGVELSDELVDEVQSRLLNLLFIADIVCYVLMGLGSALAIASIVAYIIIVTKPKLL